MSYHDEEMEKYLDGIIGAVEANSFECMCIYKHYVQELKKDWIDSRSGYLEFVGTCDNRPVYISVQVYTVDGHRILFYHPTSQMVDWKLIDWWLNKTLPKTAFRKDGYVNSVDAMNFHNVFP